MNKNIDPLTLSQRVMDILDDSVKSSTLAERVLAAIHDMTDKEIKYKNYDFHCSACGKDSIIEQVTVNVTLISRVDTIYVKDLPDGTEVPVVEFSSEEPIYGSDTKSKFRCACCKTELGNTTILEIAKGRYDKKQ